MEKKLHVHFMGIGGSGTAPVAIIAKKLGFEVSGCDMEKSSYYGDELRKNSIEIKIGHNIEHLEGVDVVAVSPAIFDINPDHPELVEARRRNILMTWQEFMGKYLHDKKELICIAGTHGKSTTTILAGLTFEAGGLDPIVEAGTIYKPWGSGFRFGNSKYFVCEADEFNCNFLNYSPSVAIINNIEMDHPEYFKDFNEFKNAFKGFIKNIKKQGILVVNEESQGIRDVLIEMKEWLNENDVKVIGYYIKDKFDFPFNFEYRAEVTGYTPDSIEYNVDGEDWNHNFKLGIPGEHNLMNSLGVVCAAYKLGVDLKAISSAFENYKGIGRRGELVGEVRGIKVYDDYGHHPTAISATLDTFKMCYPDRCIWAIYEPHQISRLKLFLEEFASALNKADKVIVTKTFVGREIHKKIQPIDMDLLIKRIDEGKAEYIEDFDDVAKNITSKVNPGDVIIVFGAGNSHKLTKGIIDALQVK